MPERVYICVNSWRPWGLPVLLVRATRAAWAREKAAEHAGFPFGWYCIRVRRVEFDGEVAEATPELLREARLSPPPGFHWLPKQVVERLNALAAEVSARG